MKPAWYALVALAAAGCLGRGAGPTAYLEYSIENLALEDRQAGLGPHCADATVDGDRAQIEREAYAALGVQRPFLIVQPDLKRTPGSASFYTTGLGGFPVAFPARVEPMVGEEAVRVASIDHREGRYFVDGEPVEMPYSWTAMKAGEWRAELRLDHGPSDVRLFSRSNCI